MEGTVAGLYQSVSARIGLEVGLDGRQQVHSASCTMEMAWISTSWWYNMSTPSVVGGVRCSRVSHNSLGPSSLTVGAGSISLGSSLGGDEVHH
jgi:hypothetical protein